MTSAAQTLEEQPRISHAGSSALLLDVGGRRFCLPTQQRLWSLVMPDSPLRALPWVRECVLGVNNLLLLYDPSAVEHPEVRTQLQRLWQAAEPAAEAGATHEVPVDYDVSDGSDLAAIAARAGMATREVVQLHSSAEYRVACVGSMPGFAYLVGLPERLATPRRASPRPAMPKGAVIIGGAQAGVMPCMAPSGWHALGATDASVFDPQRPNPSLFAPGDRVVFKIRGVSP
jgi:KipI family sensor histidine kinase inhibitor